MQNQEQLEDLIKGITASQYYEGDFGDVVKTTASILSSVEDERAKLDFPSDYIDFIKNIGFGELDSSFFMEDGPAYYTKIYAREIQALDGMYIFASDQSEYVFAFDSLNQWRVVDIDSNGIVANILSSTFFDFIYFKLTELTEIVDWREQNF